MNDKLQTSFYKMRKTPERKDLVEKVDEIALDILDNVKRGNTREVFFPELINRLDFKIGAEVGVFKGEFAKLLLSKTSLEQLYGVDFWHDDEIKKEALGRLDGYMKEGRSILMTGYSHKMAKKFEDNSLDYVYIDGDHSFEGTLVDLYAWTRKVKIGGVLSGHDFKNGRSSSMPGWCSTHLRKRVEMAVTDFALRHGYCARGVVSRCSNWYFVKNKELDESRTLIEA